tara:strand:+ start:254 stop:406 length:153 start_codon:yes stop_codon:yes gene_type:complete
MPAYFTGLIAVQISKIRAILAEAIKKPSRTEKNLLVVNPLGKLALMHCNL